MVNSSQLQGLLCSLTRETDCPWHKSLVVAYRVPDRYVLSAFEVWVRKGFPKEAVIGLGSEGLMVV